MTSSIGCSERRADNEQQTALGETRVELRRKRAESVVHAELPLTAPIGIREGLGNKDIGISYRSAIEPQRRLPRRPTGIALAINALRASIAPCTAAPSSTPLPRQHCSASRTARPCM